LISTVAPATLSVGQSEQSSFSKISVPRMNISSSDWGNDFTYPWTANKGGGQRQAESDTPRVARIINAVSTSGQILPFAVPSTIVNASYTIEASIPTIKCRKASPEAATYLVAALTAPSRPLDSNFVFNFCDAQDSGLCTEGAVAYAAIGGDETTRGGLQNLTYSFDDNSGYDLASSGSMLVAVGMSSVDIFKCQVQNSSVQISV
jgi:hypothetical protein